MKHIDLNGGLVMVTGGGGAIGSAIAMESAQAGAAVAVCDINECAAKKVADAIQRKGGKATAFRIDVRDRNDVDTVTAQAVEQLVPLHGLVTAAGELASRGIRVNNVAPGWVNGGFTHQALAISDHPDQLRDQAKQLHALGRMAEPTDVANAVVWLLSDQASFVTGSMLLVDGGFMIQHKS